MSSDEEDDKEFIRNVEANREQDDLENGGRVNNGQGLNHNNASLDVRDLLMN